MLVKFLFLISADFNSECYMILIQTFEEVEQYILGGQKLQGPHTVYEVYHLLKENDLLAE